MCSSDLLEWRFFSSTLAVDWREVMSWYAVDGPAYTVIGTSQQEPESIDACWWSSPLTASAIARGSVQPELWDLGNDWPWWHWDPGGLFVGWYSERSVWDPGIEGSIPRGLTQVHSST